MRVFPLTVALRRAAPPMVGRSGITLIYLCLWTAQAGEPAACNTESQRYRMAWAGGVLKDHSVPFPCWGQDYHTISGCPKPHPTSRNIDPCSHPSDSLWPPHVSTHHLQHKPQGLTAGHTLGGFRQEHTFVPTQWSGTSLSLFSSPTAV